MFWTIFFGVLAALLAYHFLTTRKINWVRVALVSGRWVRVLGKCVSVLGALISIAIFGWQLLAVLAHNPEQFSPPPNEILGMAVILALISIILSVSLGPLKRAPTKSIPAVTAWPTPDKGIQFTDVQLISPEKVRAIKSSPKYLFYMAELEKVKGAYPDVEYIRETNAIWTALIEHVNEHATQTRASKTQAS